MLIEIDGRRYPVAGIEDLELRHIAQLQYELGSGEFDGITSLRTVDQIKAEFGRWGNLSKAERATDPNALFLTCFTVWAARNLAGERLTLMEAISVPASALRIIAEPSDNVPAGKWENYPGGEGEGKARTPHPGSVGGGQPGRPRRRRRR